MSTLEKHSDSLDINYIEDNKKNLKNFFKDRIPENNVNKITYKSRSNSLDPTRIFEIKRQQYELKNQTKITLNKSLLDRKYSLCDPEQGQKTGRELNKIKQIFYVNDKTLELKEKYGVAASPPKVQSYSRDNHRRGTQSFAEKRTKLVKR